MGSDLQAFQLTDTEYQVTKNNLKKFCEKFFVGKRKLCEVHVAAANFEDRQREGVKKVKDGLGGVEVFSTAIGMRNGLGLGSAGFRGFMGSWDEVG